MIGIDYAIQYSFSSPGSIDVIDKGNGSFRHPSLGFESGGFIVQQIINLDEFAPRQVALIKKLFFRSLPDAQFQRVSQIQLEYFRIVGIYPANGFGCYGDLVGSTSGNTAIFDKV